MGDLMVTCWSKLGRNRRAGELIAQGRTRRKRRREIGQVVEGLNTAPPLRDLHGDSRSTSPSPEAVCSCSAGSLTDLVGSIMGREPTPSSIGLRGRCPPARLHIRVGHRGHPDKVADQISDSVLDAVLAKDPKGRVACETLVTTGLVMVAGEISTETCVDVPRLVRDRIAEIGYTHHGSGARPETCGVITSIQEQSPDIARGVDEAYEVQHDLGGRSRPGRRRRQGMMFGYASSRDAAADAAAHHARPRHLPPPGRDPQGGHARVPASRRQGDGHCALRG